MGLYRRESGIYWVSFVDRKSGEQIRKTTKTRDRREAQAIFEKLKYELWQQEMMGVKPRYTWDQAALRWLDEKASKKSIGGDIIMLRHLTPYLSKKYLDEITSGEIMMIAEKKKAESSPARANRHLALVRAIFNRAMKIWEWIEKVPHIQLYREPKGRVRYLTTQEIHRLDAELPAHLKPVSRFAIMTGPRQSNILNLRWEQVDFTRRLIIIAGSEMKSGNQHAVPITPAMQELLMSVVHDHNVYVFTYRGNPIRYLGNAWKRAVERAGITDFRFYDRRHTWSSILRQAGVPLDVIQEMGGWQSGVMVQRYAHLDPQQIMRNASIVDRIFKGSITFLSPSPKSIS